jgi:iron(III) transport system substrate-binding protein
MEYCIGENIQQIYADLGLLPTTTGIVSKVDPEIAKLEQSKLLGTTDAAKMDKMLTLAKQIYP